MNQKHLLAIFSCIFLLILSCADQPTQNNNLQRNKLIISELITEGLNNKNSDIALKLASENFVDKDAFPNQPEGPEGLKFHFETLTRAIPDLEVDFRLIAEGNTVVEIWTGSGNAVVDFETFLPLETPFPITQSGITVFELNENGKVTERYTFQRGEQ